MARKGFRNLSDMRRTTFNIDAMPCSFAPSQKPLRNHPFYITVFICDQKPYPILFLYCSVQCRHSCNMNFTSCLQSSDLSFGDNGGSRFDSPESNKLWNLRVSLIARLVLTSHHWLNFCVIVTRGLGGGGVLPSNRLMELCRWMGSHFRGWIDYNGVAFSIALLEWDLTFFGSGGSENSGRYGFKDRKMFISGWPSWKAL